MKSKVEKVLDEEFEAMEIKPRVYHFTGVTAKLFGGITVVDNSDLSWNGIHNVLDTIFYSNRIALHEGHSPASRMRRLLQERGIYGIAICDNRDPYSKKRGREIAKGRLWTHITGKRLKIKKVNGKYEVIKI